MLTTIIRGVIRFKVMVLVLMAVVTLSSMYYVRSVPLDAIPDISDAQIVLYVKWDRSPELIDNEVVKPAVKALLGTSGIKNIRATSNLGYSFIYIILDDENKRERLRRLVLDKINAIRYQLPDGVSINMAPNASSTGWIYQYAIVDKKSTRDLRELRFLNESLIKPQLQTVTGIAEVATVGGLERQIVLKIFPPLLEQTGVTLRQLELSLKQGFQQVGGRIIELTNRDYHLRATVNTSHLDSIENLMISRSADGQAILLKDIGYLQVDYDIRRGIADLDGSGEVVGGIVVMEQEKNVISVSQALKQKIDGLQSELPDGIIIVTTYDRTSFIWASLKNFSKALAYELLIVILVIIWALRNARAAVAPVIVILLGCLYAVISLSFIGQTINLLSLAGLAIAIGEMADATIVIVENCATELAKKEKNSVLTYADRIEVIVAATARMMRPLLFSLLIILVSFLPVFFLEQREGRMFDPLAFSKTFAMGFSTLLTLVLLPILITWIFNKNGHNTVLAGHAKKKSYLVSAYCNLLGQAVQYRYQFVMFSIVVFIFSVALMSNFQKDYMPEIDEGSLLYMPTTLPGIPMREAGWILQKIDKKIKALPEVERVFGKLGRADTATDPAPVTMIETTILLKPESQWRTGMTKKRLIAEMDAALSITGFVNSWTQPIAGRILMQDSGIQTPVGVKVRGTDINEIEKISRNIEALLSELPDTASVIAERIAEGYYVDVQYDLEKLAQQAVTVDEAMLTVRYALGAENIMKIRYLNSTLVPFGMQYSPEYIDTIEKVRNLPVVTSDGRSVVLHSIASVSVRKMPEMIRNDNGQLSGYIYVDINGQTAVDYVINAKDVLSNKLDLPDGYSLEWTGTYQYAEQASKRLIWIIPLSLLTMFGLLLLAFKSVAESLLILLSAPFALIGGVVLQWWQGYPLTTAVIIGYIAVLAIALQTGILMVEFIRDALQHRVDKESYSDAIIRGSVARLRPKLMTVATTVLGLIPIAFATGSGMDIIGPIAGPSIGGMVSSTVYVLFLIPCLYVIAEDFKSRWFLS